MVSHAKAGSLAWIGHSILRLLPVIARTFVSMGGYWWFRLDRCFWHHRSLLTILEKLKLEVKEK